MRIEDALANPERRKQIERLKAVRARGHRGQDAQRLPVERRLASALQVAQAVKRGMWYGPSLPPDGKRPTTADIINAIAWITGVSRQVLLSKTRTRVVTVSRQVAIAAAIQWTGLSLPRVGHLFGGLNHTTVLHAVRIVEKRRAEGHEATCELIEQLAERLGQEWVPHAKDLGPRYVNRSRPDPWTPERLADLERLWAENAYQRDIAVVLGGGISQNAVSHKLQDLRRAKPDAMAIVDRQRHEAQLAAQREKKRWKAAR